MVPDAGAVIDYNRFLYTRGNPLRYIDPTGHYIYEDKPDDPFIWYGDKPAKGLVRTAEPIYIPSERRDTSPVTAISVGLGVNADAAMIGPFGFSGTGGIEVLAHKDGEVALYTYGGAGATVGIGANAKVYVSRVRDLPDADSYQGVFEVTDGTASVGVGLTAGRFSAPLEPDGAHGEFFGFAPGANLSASESVVNYTLPWVKFDFTTGELSSPLLDDLRKKLRGESSK
ncbi:MAG: hypothetical protein D6694_06185 [Gammaproteobacteria bacterium]|nr:MAG: hypothetical protein D6694_06185 [Gammaproteobacteria bacterium]